MQFISLIIMDQAVCVLLPERVYVADLMELIGGAFPNTNKMLIHAFTQQPFTQKKLATPD
jgi:hypothetical protein